MRLLFIICEAGIDHRVTEILDHLGAPGHTRFANGTGSGHRGRREGTPVWPGMNTLIMAAVPEPMVAAICEQIDCLETERSGRLAIKVFSVPADEYC